MYIWGLNVKKITNIIPHFNILHEAEVSKELGAVHKRRQQLGGGKGWKIGQNCWRILLKNCQYGERGVKKFRKIANVVYGWSLREMIRTSNAQIREQVCLDTFPIWIINQTYRTALLNYFKNAQLMQIDLNRRKLPQNTNVPQTLQNSMIRVIQD